MKSHNLKLNPVKAWFKIVGSPNLIVSQMRVRTHCGLMSETLISDS